MENSEYGYRKKVEFPFSQAVERTEEVLQSKGFGLLMKIDVQQKMKEKLGKEMEPYMILGACHPPSAFETLQAEKEIGLLLPCNVIVYEKQGDVFVSAFVPEVAMGFIQNSKLPPITAKVGAMLRFVIDAI
ncbi:DUF302 domain-containing protein [Candidatus Gracilibacteria bacterium]|nr:DUF302 domain-containing protein [Candidatus Gracilibacteria bacterium]